MPQECTTAYETHSPVAGFNNLNATIFGAKDSEIDVVRVSE